MESLRSQRDELIADRALGGVEFCRRYAQVADEWLQALFEEATGGEHRGLALLAVGGYGRGELAPGSDLDLLLVHDRRQAPTTVAQALWYPIWDQGVSLDHSVRRPREVRAAMEGDLKVALGLLECRRIAGDETLAAEVAAKARDMWRSRAERWLAAAGDAAAARHRSHGDLAFLLEPDLKEARGGLRDLHLLVAAASVAPPLSGVAADPALAAAGDILTSARVALQRVTGRDTNRLSLQDQDTVAAAVASPDADALMGDVAGAARTVAWSSDDGWRRVASWLTGPGRRAGADRAVGPGLVLRDGEIALGPGADPGGDPSHALRAAVAAVEYGVGLSRQALDRLAAETPPPPDPWPESLRHSLVRLLDCGPPALATIEALDQKGLLVRLLPEWEFVRNRPQRNAYHRFTVDRHLLEAAAGAASLVRRVERPDLLIVGTLLHDIGKGRPGDHSQVGAELAVSISGRMGFTPADVGIIATLVSQHLLLADTAVRRDLDDPATVAMVAAAVGDAPTLELLAALTEADALATGPAAWGTWKEGLVRTLVARTASHLAGRPVTVPAPSEPTAEQRAMLAAGRLDLKATGERLTVVAPDRPGLLAVVAGVLALRGVDVLSATTGQGDNGMALLVFDVAPTYTDLPDWSQVRADVEAALDGRLALAERLAEQDATERRRRRRRAAATPRIEVGVHHGASAVATVVEVRAPDGPGVLSHIAAALAGAGLSIISARAGTYGAEVVDAFYVVGPDGAPLGPGARGDAAVAAVKAALAER